MKDWKKSLKRIIAVLDPIFENKWFYVLMLPLAALFVSFYSYTTSPFFINDSMDSCVFKSMGLAILQGKTPYVDFFDHKGPILYFINAFGQWLISGRLGIFLLQIIAETIIFSYLYRTIRLFLRGSISIIVFCFSLLIYSGLYQEGNQCEEWILLAVAPCMFYTLSTILNRGNKFVNNYYGIILGFLFGWAFYIRPNDAVSLIGGCMTGLFLWQMFIKYHQQAIKNAIYFFGAFICVTLPIIIFFAERNAVHDFYYGMIQHNTLYAGGIKHMLTSCRGHAKMTFFLMIMTMCILAYYTEFKKVLWALIPIMSIAWIVTGTNFFPHYLISFVPIFMLFGTFLMCQKSKSRIVMALCVLYCSSYAAEVNYLKSPKQEFKWRYKALKHKETSWAIAENKTFYEESEKLFSIIPQQEQDSIWNYNLMWGGYSYFSIFWHHQIIQCNRVPYYPMNMVDSVLRESESIKLHMPLWIMLTHEYDKEMSDWTKWDKDYQFIDENYSFVAQTDTSICDIELYKRKMND